MLSLDQLNKIFLQGAKSGRNAENIDPLNSTLAMIKADKPILIAAFLSQIGVESAEFKYVKEIGGHNYLDKYDTGKLAERLGNTPEDDDDGEKYCGRDWIELSGKKNYQLCGEFLGLDLINHPELLELPEHRGKATAWFWIRNGLNNIAGDVMSLTKRVNGGLNGYAERKAYYDRAKTVLGA